MTVTLSVQVAVEVVAVLGQTLGQYTCPETDPNAPDRKQTTMIELAEVLEVLEVLEQPSGLWALPKACQTESHRNLMTVTESVKAMELLAVEVVLEQPSGPCARPKACQTEPHRNQMTVTESVQTGVEVAQEQPFG